MSLHDSCGAQGPPRQISVDLDNRIAAFVAVQAIAEQQVAPIKASAAGCAGDSDPAIAVEAAHGEDVRQRCHAAASNATRLQCSTGRGTPAVLATMVSTSAMVKVSSGIFARADLDYIIQMRGATIRTDQATAIHPLQ